MLGEDPYTPTQLLNNAIQLLLGRGLYLRDFEEWDCKIPTKKIWINLKPFIQEAYQHRLNATTNTTGQHGYVQNGYAILKVNKDDDHELDDDVATVTTHLAAMTTQSQLTATSMAVNAMLVTTAINQLAANQMA